MIEEPLFIDSQSAKYCREALKQWLDPKVDNQEFRITPHEYALFTFPLVLTQMCIFNLLRSTDLRIGGACQTGLREYDIATTCTFAGDKPHSSFDDHDQREAALFYICSSGAPLTVSDRL